MPQNTNRESQILSILDTILSDLSGFELSELDMSASFLELGFDSLFLIQFSTSIKGELGVQVSFRQMIEETPTFPSLAAYLDANLAPDALTSIASEEAEPLLESASMVVPDGETEQDVYTSTSAPVPISASEPPTPVPLQQFTPPTLPTPSMPPPGPTAPNPASTSGLEALLAQQMQLMSMQLAMLSGQAMPAQTQIPQVELPPVKSPPPQPSNIPPTPTQATMAAG